MALVVRDYCEVRVSKYRCYLFIEEAAKAVGFRTLLLVQFPNLQESIHLWQQTNKNVSPSLSFDHQIGIA
jgi:hypothetical protein